MTASNPTKATIARASLIALLIITPSRIPMMNVVTDSTEVRVVRSRPFAISNFIVFAPWYKGLFGENRQRRLKREGISAR